MEWSLESADYNTGFCNVFTTSTINKFIADNIAALCKLLSIDNEPTTPVELTCLKSKIDATEWNCDSASINEFDVYCFEDDDLDDFIADNTDKLKEVLSIETNKSNIDQLVNSKSIADRINAAFNPYLTSEQINQLLNDTESKVVCCIALHPNLTQEQIDQLISGKWIIREAVAKQPNLNTDQIQKLVEDECISVREIMASRHDLTKKQLIQLLNDSATCVGVNAYNTCAKIRRGELVIND